MRTEEIYSLLQYDSMIIIHHFQHYTGGISCSLKTHDKAHTMDVCTVYFGFTFVKKMFAHVTLTDHLILQQRIHLLHRSPDPLFVINIVITENMYHYLLWEHLAGTHCARHGTLTMKTVPDPKSSQSKYMGET